MHISSYIFIECKNDKLTAFFLISGTEILKLNDIMKGFVFKLKLFLKGFPLNQVDCCWKVQWFFYRASVKERVIAKNHMVVFHGQCRVISCQSESAEKYRGKFAFFVESFYWIIGTVRQQKSYVLIAVNKQQHGFVVEEAFAPKKLCIVYFELQAKALEGITDNYYLSLRLEGAKAIKLNIRSI